MLDFPHIDLIGFTITFIAVAAEYLARGYTLSDSILQQAIEMDSKNFDHLPPECQ